MTISNVSVFNISWSTSKVLKIFGYATFSLKNLESQEIHVTFYDFLLLSINLLIACGMTYKAMLYDPVYIHEKTIMTFVGKFTMTSAGVVCIISMICCFAFRHKIWKIVNILQGIDDRFKEIKVQTEFKNARRIYGIALFSLIAFILFGAYIMIFKLNYGKKLQIVAHFVYLSTSYSFCMMWMILFNSAIYRRFKIMNEILE